jgi:RNA polymerase sigma-70 factor (ECF subfamily)
MEMSGQPFPAGARGERGARGLQLEPGVTKGGDPARLVSAEPSDEALALAAGAADELAFTLLVRRYLRRAMAVAIEYAPIRADAEDIVQEAFGRAYEALARFDASRSFAPWFFTIVRNTARNAARSRRIRTHEALSTEYASDSPGPFEETRRMELRSRIRKAIGQLTPMQAKCFRLCMIEGMTSVEVAAALDLAKSTVRVHVFQARRALQGLLDDWRNEEENR